MSDATILQVLAKALESEAREAAASAKAKGGMEGLVDVAEAGAVMRIAKVVWQVALSHPTEEME